MRAASLILLMLLAQPAMTDEAEIEAVLSAVQDAFDAVRSQRREDWDEVLYSADGNILAFRPMPDAEPPAMESQLVTFGQRLAGIEPNGVDYVETWESEPNVWVRGPLAVVIGRYRFHIDGELSHCGSTIMDLAKEDNGWKVVNWSFTVEPEGCRTRQTLDFIE